MKNLIIPMVIALLGVTSVSANELTIYTSRDASYVKPLFDDYSRETGVAVSYIVATADTLIDRLEKEGAEGPADLLLVTGAEFLVAAEVKGLLTPVTSGTLEKTVPNHLKSAGNYWYALSKRARTIVYNSAEVDEKELSGYQDLADDKWHWRLCMTTSTSEYNRALIALFIERYGEAETLAMVKGWVENLDALPASDDEKLMELMELGACDVGVINSYYYVRQLMKSPDTSLKLFWADQKGEGVSINITGAGVTANTDNKDQAVDFLEWMTTKRPQSTYANLSMEYPVNPKVYPPREIGKWGRFKEDTQPVENAGKYEEAAKELIKQAGFK